VCNIATPYPAANSLNRLRPVPFICVPFLFTFLQFPSFFHEMGGAFLISTHALFFELARLNLAPQAHLPELGLSFFGVSFFYHFFIELFRRML